MGVEAQFQAIPEDCELLARARADLEIAEWMQFIHTFATKYKNPPVGPTIDEDRTKFYYSVKELVSQHPGLEQRYFLAPKRTFAAIIYLLSPIRRDMDWDNDQSLIHKAIYGTERLHPEANATQGYPIGFVPAYDTHIIAEYLDIVTVDQLHEFYKPEEMDKAEVYKMHATDGEERFHHIWEEFVGMRDVYRAAADHHEAMIVVID